MRRIVECRTAIINFIGGARPFGGVIACPICGGDLSFRITSKGHVTASCNTIECVAWME